MHFKGEMVHLFFSRKRHSEVKVLIFYKMLNLNTPNVLTPANGGFVTTGGDGDICLLRELCAATNSFDL